MRWMMLGKPGLPESGCVSAITAAGCGRRRDVGGSVSTNFERHTAGDRGRLFMSKTPLDYERSRPVACSRAGGVSLAGVAILPPSQYSPGHVFARGGGCVAPSGGPCR
jgi:hypothetical protein